MNSLFTVIALLIIPVLITGSIFFWTLRLGIGPTPTSYRVRSVVSTMLPDNVTGDIVELGCGWGHMIPILREKYPENNIMLWERSPVPALYTQMRYSINVIRKDFFNADLKNAGIIVCYLFQGAMKRFDKEIIPKLPKNCWILTHTFRLPDRKPEKKMKANDLYRTTIYLYRLS